MGLLTWPVGSWLNIFTSQSHSLRKRLCYFQVQAGAPRFQGVPKHLDCSTSVLKQELAKWLGILHVFPRLLAREFAPAGAFLSSPWLEARGIQKGTLVSSMCSFVRGNILKDCSSSQ